MRRRVSATAAGDRCSIVPCPATLTSAPARCTHQVPTDRCGRSIISFLFFFCEKNVRALSEADGLQKHIEQLPRTEVRDEGPISSHATASVSRSGERKISTQTHSSRRAKNAEEICCCRGRVTRMAGRSHRRRRNNTSKDTVKYKTRAAFTRLTFPGWASRVAHRRIQVSQEMRKAATRSADCRDHSQML